ncbi:MULTISPECIES: UDP-N-acetylmuramoyl-L-alanyl-D-glutamate--2,6-diaminopimelate ligase [unclassified Shewanella]|uniref:UDP-N-acetylmuramoyl-L-alanyl-D-glutamate--2, 6-diaminopimelate ligase n=1 Tax=unclassified Shewanella TaxID=196818 RepID=UPI001BB98C83|nr:MULTISPECIES: UDP-N-acetylmuramoyl-L-alanyl-D-glutamate--2,6-diaminopimelate ligase [unclassified Shewanella]GIU11625.1 UDP-N-acetylmuramyl-tripeptide synthetase [Shewanella sp. MBTL60-112-B1]GIU31400.1 UDP-N-acetylmuramyl-tripeptide synthetase [Shewanella sp. MBTL60-112-B2]
MLIRDLLAPWFHYSGAEDFSEITLDSRAVQAGYLFVAIPGYQVDGRKFITAAFERGANAALVHTDSPEKHGTVVNDGGLQILFFQLNRQISALAAQAYPMSQTRPQIVGVTGTNGKTSVTQLIAQLQLLQGKRTAVMGTLGNGLWGELVDSGNTTADPVTLIKQLQEFEQKGANTCAMEVSSHGLVQGRVEAVPFDVAVFTNLSRDHLDYHHTMEEYGIAKKRLFQFANLRGGLINIDDPVGREWLIDLASDKLLGFSVKGNASAEIYTKDNHFHDGGVSCTLVWPTGEAELSSPLLGDFNLSNLVAALGALYLLGEDMRVLVALAAQLEPVAGRMERFTSQEGVTLVVDYAHTPDAIEQALKALRVHCKGQLWCLFGCGGDRDKGKRPMMAASAEQFADRVMVTSDNCRSEDPNAIISDILAGLQHPQQALSQVDRQAAIKQIVAQAASGDMVLLAGKGHETYQEVDGKKLNYDERAFAKAIAEGNA